MAQERKSPRPRRQSEHTGCDGHHEGTEHIDRIECADQTRCAGDAAYPVRSARASRAGTANTTVTLTASTNHPGSGSEDGANSGGSASPGVRATAVGLLAIVLWSLMTGLVRVVADSFGATLGSALIYTFGVVLLMIFHRPAPLREYPRRYLLIGGLLFVFYESAISLSIGLASSAEGSVEVSLVNYLWPTMMVLLSAAFVSSATGAGASAGSGSGPDDAGTDGTDAAPAAPASAPVSRTRAVLRVLPGAIVATVGVALAVGGNSGLDWGLAVRHVGENPWPYLMAFCGAFAWSVYAVFTPALARGKDGTSVFFPLVAVALWIIHFASGQGWPAAVPPVHAWLAVLGAAAVIAGGYACWGYGILHGSMTTLALASYATPVLSTAASAVLLGLSLTMPFWCGALLVALGSMINWWVKSRASH